MFKKKNENVMTILKRSSGLKYKMIIHSFVIGLLAGGIIVGYRLLGEVLLKSFKKAYIFAENGPIYIVGIFLLLAIMAYFVAYCVRQEPNISGSGIPQVEGAITKRISTNWKKVLFYKFFGGIVALAAGLSVGREGPSIQMGASVGEGVSKFTNKLDYEHKYLMTSGASAGLAAAFNAPLAGVMFALEEVHKNFSPIVLLSAMVSAVTADVITKSILGINPALMFKHLNIMPIKYYWSLIILGIVLGICGYIFNHGVIFSKHLYKKMPIRLEHKILIPFMFSGLVGLTFPVLLGGGHDIIVNMQVLHLTIFMTFAFLVIKYIFTFVAFGSGVPGGIFLPLLGIGALAGNLVGLVCIKLGVPQDYLVNFAVLAMAGHFAATVKAPITGIILIFEMTGTFEHLLPLSIVVFVALIVSDLLNVEPVYDMLLEDILKGNHTGYEGQPDKKTLIEFSVQMTSQIEGNMVKDIEWPDDCLLVSIKRASKEIIPRGNTQILEGDMITVMVNQTESARMIDYFTAITSHI